MKTLAGLFFMVIKRGNENGEQKSDADQLDESISLIISEVRSGAAVRRTVVESIFTQMSSNRFRL